MNEARSRGLFNTKIDFNHLRHRVLITEVASAAKFYFSDPISAWTKILPASGIHHEWFLNAHIYRSPVLVLSSTEDVILRTLNSGFNRLPSSKIVEAALLLSSEFKSEEEARDFLIFTGKRHDPRLRHPERLLSAAKDPILKTLMHREDHSIEAALYLFDHKITNDPHELWRLFSGELIIASPGRCLIPGRAMYMLLPKKVYEDSVAEHQVIDVYDFDLVIDPVQRW